MLDDTLMKPFDLTTCRSKLEGHYLKTSTVPTSVWSKKAVVDIHQIYTRLSFVKDPEKTPAGITQSEPTSFSLSRSVGQVGKNPGNKNESELKHYSDLFTTNKNGVIPKRILVQGPTGIGKSTFVKKLLVDWIEVNEGNGDEQAAVLKNFELVVAVNLKEVSKCQSLVDVIRNSNVFAKEDKFMTEGLVDYISNNQEKVLLIFDGYDEYRMGCNSEIYEIFHGNSLRSCCVLITTRISKADELRGGEDLHAEITGFSKVDREDFMRRFLNSEDVSELEGHLDEKDLDQLAKVPLLLLFFCILWKQGKSKSFPESKTKLYLDIVQFILNHSYSKQTADKTKTKQYVELKSYKEILSEIGKVALQSLLKDDHLFEYSQLSDSVRLDESVFIGLLQITEYSENLRPVGMVSFIHKSIQEFLAAWYITYRCIPVSGNLAEIGEKFEECMALENVFPFLCGLSQDGALATFRYLKSVRMSDPSLDLSKTVPEEENETDTPLSDVTDCQRKFSDLVSNAFEEVELKAELSRACLDSLGSILLVTESFPNYLLLNAIDTNSWSLVSHERDCYLAQATISRLYEIVKKLIIESSEALRVAEFLEKFVHSYDIWCFKCGFSFVLCFRNGQVYFYITRLTNWCENHAKLIADNAVSSHSVHQSSGQLSLEFLKTLECQYIEHSMTSLGAAIKNCNYLEHLEVLWSNNYLSHILKNVPNPRKCSLSTTFCSLTSKEAVELASLLPKFELVIRLSLCLANCSAEAVARLVASIKHKTLKELELSEMNLTTAAAQSLGQSLPELSALQTLRISDVTLCSAEAGTRLFAGIKHKTLKELKLSELYLTTAVAESLGQSLPELSALQTLWIRDVTLCSAEAGTRLFAGIKHKTLEDLELSKINLTTAAAESLGQSLPELSALQALEIGSLSLCSPEATTRLFAGIKHKTLETLELSELYLTTAAAQSLRQSLPELSALQTLKISDVTLCSAEAGTKLFAGIKHKTLEKLELRGMNLTSAVAVALGQSLPELPSLQILTISGSDGCSLQLEFLVLGELKINDWPEFSAELVTRLINVIKPKRLEVLELTEIHLTSAEAKALGQLLPELSALKTLKISDLVECSDDAVTKLVSAIKHKTLEELELCLMNLTSTVAGSLAQSLPELSALRTLRVSGLIECSDEAVTKLVTAIKHKTLKKLKLSKMNLTSAATMALGQALPELSALQTLKISGLTESSDEAVAKLVTGIKHKTLEELQPSGMNLTSAAAVTLVQSLPELPSLQKLEISGSDGYSLQLEFPVFRELKIKRWPEFSAEAVTRLIDVIKHKPLEKLELSEISLTSAVAEALGQLLPELSALQTLKISGLTECSDDAVTKLVSAIKHKTLEELELCLMNLTSTVAGSLAQSLPELSALRTLRVSGLIECSDEAVTKLVTAIKHKTLKKLKLSKMNLTSAATMALGQALPELSALQTLKISGLTESSDEAVAKLVTGIKHKTLEELQPSGMNLTSAAAVTLVQSLPELPSLQKLEISGSDGYSLQLEFPVFRELKIKRWPEFSAEAVTRLIDVIKHKPLEKLELSEISLTSAVAEALGQLLPELSALQTLKISGLTECSDEGVTKLVSAIKHKTLEKLKLSEIHLTSVAAEALGQSLPELSALQTLKISGLTECSDEGVTKFVAAIKHKTLEELELSEIHLTSVAAEALGQSLPELSALRTLKIIGSDECTLQHKEVEALFGRFNRPSSLKELWFTGFTAKGSLAPLTKNLCLFPCLKVLKLEHLDMGEADLSGLLKNLKFTPDLRSLHLMGNPVGHAVRSMIPYLFEQQKLEKVYFQARDCSEKDLKYVQEAVKEKRPRLKITNKWWLR